MITNKIYYQKRGMSRRLVFPWIFVVKEVVLTTGHDLVIRGGYQVVIIKETVTDSGLLVRINWRITNRRKCL